MNIWKKIQPLCIKSRCMDQWKCRLKGIELPLHWSQNADHQNKWQQRLERMFGKMNLHVFLVVLQTCVDTMQMSMDVSQIPDTRLIIWPSYTTPVYMTQSCTIPKAKELEPGLMSINRWVGRENMLHTHNGISLTVTEQWSPDICSKTDGIGNWYAEINQVQKDICCMFYLICKYQILICVCVYTYMEM